MSTPIGFMSLTQTIRQVPAMPAGIVAEPARNDGDFARLTAALICQATALRDLASAYTKACVAVQSGVELPLDEALTACEGALKRLEQSAQQRELAVRWIRGLSGGSAPAITVVIAMAPDEMRPALRSAWKMVCDAGLAATEAKARANVIIRPSVGTSSVAWRFLKTLSDEEEAA